MSKERQRLVTGPALTLFALALAVGCKQEQPIPPPQSQPHPDSCTTCGQPENGVPVKDDAVGTEFERNIDVAHSMRPYKFEQSNHQEVKLVDGLGTHVNNDGVKLQLIVKSILGGGSQVCSVTASGDKFTVTYDKDGKPVTPHHPASEQAQTRDDLAKLYQATLPGKAEGAPNAKASAELSQLINTARTSCREEFRH